jgi:hypothetical protein
MTEALFILIAIELGMRVFPLLDSFVELLNHLIAIGINKCDCVIRKDALKCEEEEELKRTNNSLPVIGFRAGDDSYEEAPDDDECDED